MENKKQSVKSNDNDGTRPLPRPAEEISTNTLYAIEPDTNQENEMRFVHEFIQHYIKGPAISMLPLARFR